MPPQACMPMMRVRFHQPQQPQMMPAVPMQPAMRAQQMNGTCQAPMPAQACMPMKRVRFHQPQQPQIMPATPMQPAMRRQHAPLHQEPAGFMPEQGQAEEAGDRCCSAPEPQGRRTQAVPVRMLPLIPARRTEISQPDRPDMPGRQQESPQEADRTPAPETSRSED